jgi:hypothetical protein
VKEACQRLPDEVASEDEIAFFFFPQSCGLNLELTL